MDSIFALRLVAHIHALRKIKFGGSKAMDPRLFILFHHFFRREIYFFYQTVFLAVHQIFMFLEKHKQGWDKTA